MTVHGKPSDDFRWTKLRPRRRFLGSQPETGDRAALVSFYGQGFNANALPASTANPENASGSSRFWM